MKIGSIIFFLLIFTSCSVFRPHHYNPQRISIKKLVDEDSWEVTYSLKKPVYGLVFNRQTNQFRTKNWKIIGNNDLEITKLDDLEVIKSKTKKKFKKVVIKHKSYFKSLVKDYEFFIKFSKGDVLMYVGHYSVHPIMDEKVDIATNQFWENTQKNETFEFIKPNKDIHIIVDGKVAKKNINWRNKSGRGTYVFWGKNKPKETKDLTILIASDVPTWASKNVLKNLPQTFEYYKNKLNLKLNFRPVVYLNYSHKYKKNIGNSGGTLPGLIQLTLKGKPWPKQTDETKEWLYWFLSHESAHLWNSQLVKMKRKGNHAWLHEGSADAFAYRALLEQGLISKNKYIRYIENEKKSCLRGLKEGFPLKQSSDKKKFGNYYSCGHMIALLTEKTIEGDIFSFWKKLLNSQFHADGEYNDEEYFELWGQLVNDKNIFKSTHKLIYKDSTHALELLSKIKSHKL